jgi:hypothetical protein
MRQAGHAEATDQSLALPVLKASLQGGIHRIGRAGFVQQQQIHGLQAELSEAGLQAELAMGGAEISAHHAVAIETKS